MHSLGVLYNFHVFVVLVYGNKCSSNYLPLTMLKSFAEVHGLNTNVWNFDIS